MRMILATTFVSLLALPAACGEEAPTRPDDGSVPAWESCQWEGQNTSELCEPGLVCSGHGVCSPSCEMAEDCTLFDGFEGECGSYSGQRLCEIRCNSLKECPETGAVPLKCLDTYCIGDP
jgi:hypothetical protein